MRCSAMRSSRWPASMAARSATDRARRWNGRLCRRLPATWLVEAERLALDAPWRAAGTQGARFRAALSGGARCWSPLREALARLLAARTEFELLPAHMLWEVRPRGADKGKAVAGLMDRPPFRGRLPVFIGDDVTDEDGIAAAKAMGGSGCACRMRSAMRPVCAPGYRRLRRTGTGRAAGKCVMAGLPDTNEAVAISTRALGLRLSPVPPDVLSSRRRYAR